MQHPQKPDRDFAFRPVTIVRPVLVEETLPLVFQKLLLGAVSDEHATTSFLLDETFINQFLVHVVHVAFADFVQQVIDLLAGP